MSATMFSSTLLRRLGRTVLLGGVVFLPLAACGDDNDGDDISGPTADCIDDIDFNDWFFDEGDVDGLSLGNDRSGSISTSDVELEFEEGIFFYDVYVFGLDSQSDVTITVNPSGDFDPTFEIMDLESGESEYVDNGGAGVTEEISYEDVPEGCYILFVSSFEPEETGSYTVEVDDN